MIPGHAHVWGHVSGSLGVPETTALGSSHPAGMFSLPSVFFLVFWPAVMAPAHSSFWQFQRMVKLITGRSAFFSYYGYGCYCGLGGKGTPVDDTDR